MIPIILSMETVGINVTPLWWGLAIGVGMGGNGTHIGSTANVYICDDFGTPGKRRERSQPAYHSRTLVQERLAGHVADPGIVDNLFSGVLGFPVRTSLS